MFDQLLKAMGGVDVSDGPFDYDWAPYFDQAPGRYGLIGDNVVLFDGGDDDPPKPSIYLICRKNDGTIDTVIEWVVNSIR